MRENANVRQLPSVVDEADLAGVPLPLPFPSLCRLSFKKGELSVNVFSLITRPGDFLLFF